MGFWEKMGGPKPETPPIPPEAEQADAGIEAEPQSPELVAEQKEMKEHLSALEKIADDPKLDEKIGLLSPESKTWLGERVRDLGVLCKDIFTDAVGEAAGKAAIETALMGTATLASIGTVGTVALLGLSAASLHYVWKKLKDRAAA